MCIRRLGATLIDVKAITARLAALPLPEGPLVAALPMYDWPERRAEVDAEWAVLRDALQSRGIDAPEELSRCNADLPAVPGGMWDASGRLIAKDPATLPPDEFDFETLWHHPQLLFSQTCWGPLELWPGDAVQLVGQDDYSGIEGGDGELYSSAIVMRRSGSEEWREAPPSVLSDFPGRATGLARLRPPTGGEIDYLRIRRLSANGGAPISPLAGEMSDRTEGGASLQDLLSGLRLAYNVADSMSGYLAIERDLMAEGLSLDIFSQRIVSGGHRNSIRMVARGDADVAAVDCKTWALALQHETVAKGLEVVGWTTKRKGLPFITARR